MGLAHLKMLWSLWRGRGDNPLLAYYDPRRRNVAGWAFRLGELYLMAALVCLGLAALWGTTGSTEVAPDVVLVAAAVCAAVVPTLFLFVAPGPWSRERSIDLRLTRLTPEEIAFGFLFWPMMLLLIVGVGSGLLLVTMLVGVDEWWGASHWGSAMAMMSAGVLMCLAVGACTLERWYRNSAWRWLGLLVGPLVFLPGAAMIMFLGELTKYWIGEGPAIMLVMVVGFLWTASRARLALRAAGWRILGAGACAEELVRHHWPLRERALLKLPGKGRRARTVFLDRACLCFIVLSVVLLAVTLLAGWAGNSLAKQVLSPEDGSTEATVGPRIAVLTIEFGLLAMPAASAVGVWIASLWWGGRIPLLSGGLAVSAVAYCAPTLLVLLMSVAMLTFTVHSDAFGSVSPWADTAVLGLVVAPILVFCVLLMIPRRGRLVLSVCLAGFSVVAASRITEIPAVQHAPGDSHIMLMLLGIMTFLFIEWAMARVYRLELEAVPIGRLNTESCEGEPLAPEAVLDELAARG
jgi:hypothetical protein